MTMSAWLRVLLTVISSFRRKRLKPDEESILSFRVWPTDADVSVMNNAKYLTIMEMGRIDLMLRTGFLKLSREKRWSAPLASITVQFKKPLKRFQRFRLRTSLAYWDGGCVYVKHLMEADGETAAIGIARIVILGREGRVSPSEALEALGYTNRSPSIPPFIESLEKSERLMRRSL